MNKSKVLRSSRGIVDTTDSDESYILEDNVNKILNPSESKFRRPINFFNNVEQNPQKLRKSIITRALQNVISSTPMPSKHTRNFINTDISLDLSPINGNDEQLHNDDSQKDKTIINNENKLKSQSIVITISDSENNENANPQISYTKKNTSKGFHSKSPEEPEVTNPLSSSRNNCDEKDNSKKNANSSRKKNGNPQKLSNSLAKSVMWTKKMRRSDNRQTNEDELNISENATLLQNQIKINSKLDLHSDNRLNCGTNKNTIPIETDNKGDNSKLSAKKLSFVSATIECEKQDTLEELQVKTSKELLDKKSIQTKKFPPKPAPRRKITRQKRACNSKQEFSKENITEIATSPGNFIVQENMVLQGSVDKQINNSIPSQSGLNGTKALQLFGGDFHKDNVKTLTDVATSPCSFGKKQQIDSLNKPEKIQNNGQITESITTIATFPYNSDKELTNHSVQVSKNRLKNSSILNSNQENITAASKTNKNNSKPCEAVKRLIDIGTSPCSFSKEQQNYIEKQFVDTAQGICENKSIQNANINQQKMIRLHQLVDSLSNTKNVEVSSYSAIEDNRNMMSKEIQTSTDALLDKNPFKHFGRNISTQTVAELHDRSLKSQEKDNRSDSTNDSHLLTEFDNDILFRTVPAPNDFDSFISGDSEFSILEDSNKNFPWRLADDLIPDTETRMSIKLNFLRSAQKIQEEKQSLIDSNPRFSSNIPKLSTIKSKGTRKYKSDKCRQYTRKPSNHYSQRNRRAVPLSPTMHMDLRKKRSLTNSEKSKNTSNMLSIKELPQSEVSELNATSSTGTARNATNINSGNIQKLTNSSSVLSDRLSLKLSTESGRGNSTNECSENTVNTQPDNNYGESPELYVHIERTSLISQNIYKVPTSELSDKHKKRSGSMSKNVSVQFSEKNKEIEETNTYPQDKLPTKSLTDSKKKANKSDFSNFDDLAKLLDESLTERSQILEKLDSVNCNIEQEEPLERCNEESTSEMSEEIRTKSKMKSTSKSGGADVDTNCDGATCYELSEKRDDVAVPKKHGSRRELEQAFESCAENKKMEVTNTTSLDNLPKKTLNGHKSNADKCNFEQLANHLEESFTEMSRTSEKRHSVNCNTEDELLKKCIVVSKKSGPKFKKKNIAKRCDAAEDTISNCNRSTCCEPSEKCDVAVFKVPKKRSRKSKLKHVSESCGNISNNHVDSDVDGDHAIGIRRSGRQRKPARRNETGVIITHSIKEFKYWDVVQKKEDIERCSLQFSITQTSSRKSKSKLKGAWGKPGKITKINAKQIMTSGNFVHESNLIESNIELESSKVGNNSKINNQSCRTVLSENKNPEIGSNFSNICTEIYSENQAYTIPTNESIDQAGTSQPSNENLNSRHITADSGRSTLLTFEESNLHSIQKIGKITKDYKKKNNISNKISKILSRSTMNSNQIEIGDKHSEIDVAKEEDHCVRQEKRLNLKCRETDYVDVLVNNELVDLKYVNKDHTFVHECDNLMMTDSLRNSNYPVVGGYLKLPPGGRKLLHIPQCHSLFYFVAEGEGHIQVKNSVSKVQKMDNFIVPVGIGYAIFNDSPKDPLLLSCVKMAVSSH